MILDKNRVYDGWDSLAAGMDAGRRPSLIDDNQCAVARDVVFRGGVPKSRPGIRKLDLEYEHEIYYDAVGDEIGPGTVTDAAYIDYGLFSSSAQFTAADIGSIVIGDGIVVNTRIASIDSSVNVTLDTQVVGDHHNETVTIVRRSNPISFTANYSEIGATASSDVSSLDANFNVNDVGKTIIGGALPAGTFVTSVTNTTLAKVNAGYTASNIVSSIPSRVPNPSSSATLANEPFQCASYYAPANTRECIMATFGGRLFQITPLVRSANVREVPIPGAGYISQTFSDGVENTTTTFTSATANFTASDVGKRISGTGIVNGTAIRSVSSSTTIILNTAAIYTASGLPFTIIDRVIGARARRNRRTIKENYMVQADKWHITQDGEAKAIIFDGVSARRAVEDEIVVGKIMAYGLGRLVVTRNRDVYFGDLFGSHSGDPSDSVLQFTETKFLSEGFPAEIPYTMGEITAANFFPSQDTSTGQGELVIFTERGAVSFDLHLPREDWKKSAFQQISLINSTARGHRAVAMVNSALWIRSDEGWRDYRQARALATGWYQLPQSTEVTPWTSVDTPNLLRYGSAISFNNRLIATCNPVPNSGRLYHDGLLALDFDVLSSFGQASKPAWDGHWGKLKTLQLVTGTFAGKHRAFAFGLDEDGTTQLYEISPNDREDFDGPITSEIEFRSHNFNAPFNEKNLYGADIWVDDTGPSTVTLDLSFRPDSSTTYLPWKTIEGIRPPGACGDVTCGVVPLIGAGFAPRLRIPKPKDDCDDYTSRAIRRGYEFQPKLRWTGHAAIRRMRLQAMQEEEDSKAEC